MIKNKDFSKLLSPFRNEPILQVKFYILYILIDNNLIDYKIINNFLNGIKSNCDFDEELKEFSNENIVNSNSSDEDKSSLISGVLSMISKNPIDMVLKSIYRKLKFSINKIQKKKASENDDDFFNLVNILLVAQMMMCTSLFMSNEFVKGFYSHKIMKKIHFISEEKFMRKMFLYDNQNRWDNKKYDMFNVVISNFHVDDLKLTLSEMELKQVTKTFSKVNKNITPISLIYKKEYDFIYRTLLDSSLNIHFHNRINSSSNENSK